MASSCRSAYLCWRCIPVIRYFQMLSNHIRTAWRQLIRRKGYTLLNVFGLSIGIAGLIVIGLYLRHELSYEAVHERSDRI